MGVARVGQQVQSLLCCRTQCSLDSVQLHVSMSLRPGTLSRAVFLPPACREAFTGIEALLKSKYPHASVHIFGSAANGLGIRDNNDIDVSLSLPLPDDSRETKGGAVAQLARLCAARAARGWCVSRWRSRHRVQVQATHCAFYMPPPAPVAAQATLCRTSSSCSWMRRSWWARCLPSPARVSQSSRRSGCRLGPRWVASLSACSSYAPRSLPGAWMLARCAPVCPDQLTQLPSQLLSVLTCLAHAITPLVRHHPDQRPGRCQHGAAA